MPVPVKQLRLLMATWEHIGTRTTGKLVRTSYSSTILTPLLDTLGPDMEQTAIPQSRGTWSATLPQLMLSTILLATAAITLFVWAKCIHVLSFNSGYGVGMMGLLPFGNLLYIPLLLLEVGNLFDLYIAHYCFQLTHTCHFPPNNRSVRYHHFSACFFLSHLIYPA